MIVSVSRNAARLLGYYHRAALPSSRSNSLRTAPLTYEEEWLAIAARITALKAAAELRALHEASHTEDSYGVRAMLGGESFAIINELQRFAATHDATLPETAKAALKRFFGRTPVKAVLNEPRDGRASKAGVVAVLVIAGELTHLLGARQERLRLRSAQAFEHLQRTLAVNEDVRTRWLEAFRGTGETTCEQLGAVHLLGHGIFAFKVNAAGGRTDLVIPEPLDVDKAVHVSEGLVLTEWKLAKSDAEVAMALKEARAQADLYTAGVLGGVELAGHRYLVVVTEKQASKDVMRDKEIVNGMIYLPVNIAINPRSPFEESKRARRPQKP